MSLFCLSHRSFKIHGIGANQLLLLEPAYAWEFATVPTWSFKHLRWPSPVVFSNHTQAESLFSLFPHHLKNIPTPILNSQIPESLAKMELVSRAKRTKRKVVFEMTFV